jgi:hypothetical protein
MIVLIVLIIAALLILAIIEITNIYEMGLPISENNLLEYLDKIENGNLINGVSKRWNDKYWLQVKRYPNIYETEYSVLFPYHIQGVGVIPIWGKSYSRIKKLFKHSIEKSEYTTNERKKLGLD